MAPPPVPPKPQPAPAPVRIKPKVGRNVLTCWTYSILLAVLAVSVGLYLFAKTGVVKIPFFSDFYNGPQPTRLVKVQPMAYEAFERILSSQLRSEGLKKQKPPYVIRLTERELTGVLAQGIDTALREDEWKQVYTQVAVEPNELELVGQFRRGWVRLDALIRFVPRVTGGGVNFEPVYVKVGDYPVPARFAYQIIGYLFSRDLGAWVLKFGDLRLSAVHLSRGYLELVVASGVPGE